MAEIIPEKYKELWDLWDIRLLILVSLSLQAILVLFATWRKRSSSTWVMAFIWCAYLLADWVAAVTVGLISNSQGNQKTSTSGGSRGGAVPNSDLLALWANFLLLHLGGPDTITSFSLEDNELWIRHLLGLVLQVGAAIYVYFLSLPGNKLRLPTILILIAGTIKYGERTRALYLASLDQFGVLVQRDGNPGPDYEMVQQMYRAMKQANLPVQVETVRGPSISRQNRYRSDAPLNPKSLLRDAYRYFEAFKGLISGIHLGSEVREWSRGFFLDRCAKDAFKIIEIELSLMYEVLHTKIVLVRTMNGYIFRFVSSISVLVSFVIFISVKKREFHKFDVWLTYTLFIGALILDAVSYLKLMCFDRTISTAENWWGRRLAPIIINKRRWCESVQQCSFMNYCLTDFPQWVIILSLIFRLYNLLQKLKIALVPTHKDTDEYLREFIFEELRTKSVEAVDVADLKSRCTNRGQGALPLENCDQQIKWSVSEVGYTESLLMWHIATELCFYRAETEGTEEDTAPSVPNNNTRKKELCNLFSGYALYILLMQPTIIAPVSGNWQLVFKDTYYDAQRFFSSKKCSQHQAACAAILEVKPDINPRALKGDLSKSVLFDACMLAHNLEKFGEQQWEIMAKVWLELLCYGAIHCRASVHAQQTSKGGELITFIWLLMNHLGLGIQFDEADAARIKFVVGK